MIEQPAPPPPAPPSNRGNVSTLAKWAVAGIAVVIVGGVFSAINPSSSNGPSDLSSSVKDVCHDRVKDNLKAPATASFGGDDVYHVSGARWTATGYVDAENSFGANVRTYWNCIAIHTGGVNWNVKAWLD